MPASWHGRRIRRGARFKGVICTKFMYYSDGQRIEIGDKVSLDKKYSGVVKAIIEEKLFSNECPKEAWSYLKSGIVIDTDFGGLVQCQKENIQDEPIELISRENDI